MKHLLLTLTLIGLIGCGSNLKDVDPESPTAGEPQTADELVEVLYDGYMEVLRDETIASGSFSPDEKSKLQSAVAKRAPLCPSDDCGEGQTYAADILALDSNDPHKRRFLEDVLAALQPIEKQIFQDAQVNYPDQVNGERATKRMRHSRVKGASSGSHFTGYRPAELNIDVTCHPHGYQPF